LDGAREDLPLMPIPTPGAAADPPPESTRTVADAEPIRRFVEHWGVMARAWGINASMGELFALLYVTGTDWTAEALREELRVSRGNVSMNLRELIVWGVVHKVHRQGERREFYRAEDDVWTLFRRILAERKRRELDPTLAVLRRTVREIPDDPHVRARRDRLVELEEFFGLINALATRLLSLDGEELRDLVEVVSPDHDSNTAPLSKID
jgi:DNA-binding transcriptional regulator GbsR (MarR family)